ncbi:mycothiol transferase [Ornithinimicrobium avium]|uniref:mycothiol transferase n=1 Tax=Ornithinimicrobium avium TaxID=2283195 RepID=UPI0013B35BD2|nr:DUF664 domain-containing protein [Ornithinimicrobium avium]
MHPTPSDETITDEHGRPEPPFVAGEAATLLGFLDFQRATLAWKTRGLGEEGLRARLHPTGMTLAGLVKHLAWVEDYWFTQTAAGQPEPDPWAGVDWAADESWEWSSAVADGPEELRTTWETSVARSRASRSTVRSASSPRRPARFAQEASVARSRRASRVFGLTEGRNGISTTSAGTGTPGVSA